MARPKGSKNKIKTSTNANIQAIEADIAKLEEQLKARKDDLKNAIAAKEEEDKKRLLDAVAASGKSIEEVLELLTKKAEDSIIDPENPAE